jgi:hypothetical protein
MDNGSMKNGKVDIRKFTHQKEILREYVIYNAFSNFKNYLLDTRIVKTHDYLLDIVNRDIPWLNKTGSNIIVFETEGDKVFMVCPFGSKDNLILSRPFVFIIKQEGFYEPIIRVRQNGPHISQEFKFEFHDNKIEEIVRYYKKNCKSTMPRDGMQVHDFLQSIGYKVRRQIINYNNRLEGFLVKGGIFVPIKSQNPILIRNTTFSFVDSLLKSVKNADPGEVKALLKKLEEFTGSSYYGIKQVIKDDGEHVAFELEEGAVVPLVPSKLPREQYLDNLNIFIGWENEDERKTFIDEDKYKTALFKMLKAEMMKIIRHIPEKADELNFLKHPANPFPRSFRRQKIKDLLDGLMDYVVVEDADDGNALEEGHGEVQQCSVKVGKGRKAACTGNCIWDKNTCKLRISKKYLEKFRIRLIEALLVDTQPPLGLSGLTGKSKTLFGKGGEVLIFDQEDVSSGKISRIFKLLENPYVFFDNVADENIREMLKSEVKIAKPVVLKDLLTEGWTDLPGKFYYPNGFNMQGFEINDQKPYRQGFLLLFFKYVARMIMAPIKLNEKVLQNLVSNQLLMDIKEEGVIALKAKLTNANPFMQETLKYFENPTMDDLVTIMQRPEYFMSEYELQVIANMLGVCIFVIARKTSRNPNEIKCIKPVTKAKHYVFLFQRTMKPYEKAGEHQDMQKEYWSLKNRESFDLYEPIMKNQSQVIFTIDEVPEKVKEKCIVHFVVEEVPKMTNKAADKAADKPVKKADKPVKEAVKEVDREADKPVKEAADEPVKEAADEPVKEAADEPVKEAVKEVDREADKPVKKVVKKAVKKAVKKVVVTEVDKETDKPVKEVDKADKETDKPVKEVDKADKEADKPVKKVVKKVVVKEADKPVKKVVKKVVVKEADKPVKKVVDKEADKPVKKVVKKVAIKEIDKEADKPVKKVVKKAVPKPKVQAEKQEKTKSPEVKDLEPISDDEE